MATRRINEEIGSTFLAIVKSGHDSIDIVVAPTKDGLYSNLSDAIDANSFEHVDTEDLSNIEVTCYEVRGKPWTLELGRAKVVLSEKTE